MITIVERFSQTTRMVTNKGSLKMSLAQILTYSANNTEGIIMQDPNPLPWGAQDRFQAHFVVQTGHR